MADRLTEYQSYPRPWSKTPIWDSFVQRLRELGYIEGQNFSIEFRTTGGPADGLPDLAAELVRLNVDLILVPATQAALADSPAWSAGAGGRPIRPGIFGCGSGEEARDA